MDNATVATLLNRDLFAVDQSALNSHWSGKTVLITGAGGSIGSELVRTLAACWRAHSCRIILYDRSENNLVRMLSDLQGSHAEIVPVLGDIQQQSLLDYAFRTYSPQIVVHAAAYKHLPLLESNILQAVGNNIFGTQAVLQAAIRYRADKFVLVSTDKACNPTSIMGATKRAAEMITLAVHQTQLQTVVVRLGNVFGSSGSVIPIFERQIAAGGPVTVTHPDATRFFMAIPEAANLILHAAMLGRGGETLVLDMGAPVNIKKLAERLIAHHGKMGQVAITYTAMRPGEKLSEQLYVDSVAATDHPQIWRTTSTTTPENAVSEHHRVSRVMWQLELGLRHCGVDEVAVRLQELVPEYHRSQSLRTCAE